MSAADALSETVCVCVFRLHEQLNESDDAAQCYIIYIQDIFSCGVSY